MTKVWQFELEAMDDTEKWIKNNPDKLLFEYEDDLDFSIHRRVEVNGKYYNWCMSSNKSKNVWVNEYTYLKDPKKMTEGSSIICPVCGYRNSFETPEGEFQCAECGSTLELDRHVIISTKEHDMSCTNIVKLVKYHFPKILDLNKVRYPNKFGELIKVI